MITVNCAVATAVVVRTVRTVNIAAIRKSISPIFPDFAEKRNTQSTRKITHTCFFIHISPVVAFLFTGFLSRTRWLPKWKKHDVFPVL